MPKLTDSSHCESNHPDIGIAKITTCAVGLILSAADAADENVVHAVHDSVWHALIGQKA